MDVTYNYQYERKLKAAFIGCGGHAQRNVYPAFQFAPIDLAAVCDLNALAAEACARHFGAKRHYTDYREMLDQERPEVVFLVLNYDENGEPRYPKLTVDCMEAGAHVWLEKPPAASTEQVRSMMRASAATAKFAGVGLKKMFSPAARKAREISRLPEFGQITSISARYPQNLPPLELRNDAKAMIGFLDHMVHPHSLLRYLGGEIEWIFVNRVEKNGAAQVSIRFRSGAVGNLHLAAGISGDSPLERTEIIGEGANIVVENNLRVTFYRKSQGRAYGRTGSYYDGALETAPLTWEPEFSLGQLYNKGLFMLGYAPEIIHFTTRLLEGQGPEFGTLEEALELMKLYDAYRRPDGQVVRITEG